MDSSPSISVINVAIALVWRDGLLLLTRRKQDTHLGGFWEFPGGKCKPDEQPEYCAEREVREEVGVSVRAVSVREPITYTYPERTVRLHPVDCHYQDGEPQTLEVAEWAWVSPSDLGKYQFPPANAPLLEALRSSPGPLVTR